MSDYVVSLIRTIVPTIVGSFLGWLASQGLDLDDTAVIPAVTGICIALYYAIVRKIEERNPSVGVLLGKQVQPQYTPPFHTPDQQAA